MPHPHDQPPDPRAAGRLQDIFNHRPAAHLMQHLRQRRHERHPTGEGDHLGTRGDGEEGTHFGGGEARGAVGVVAVPLVEVGALVSQADPFGHEA